MSRWVLRKRPEGTPPWDWADRLSITPALLDILWGRGFSDIDKIHNFLAPKLGLLTNPNNWPQIPKAAEILASELLSGKKIVVWGDYDVDGITASALALDVLSEHGISAGCHLPDRRKEGYGLNIPVIEELSSQGYEILLTVDCGIGNLEAVNRARELGMTVIISDHHLPPETLPNASAIVNPRISEAGEWPCKYLAGVGVAFYLLAAVNNLLSPQTGKRFRMENVLDLVALGTLADVMRLEGENRILTKNGLDRMARSDRAGLLALKEISGFDIGGEVSSGHAVFRLAPRINAAGRMGNADVALALLRAKAQDEARDCAEKLEQLNIERKTEEDRIHRAAREQANELLAKKNYAALALYGEDWHPGIVGIVASRIVEEFNRPTIVLCEDNGTLKGSGRTAGDFNLYEGLAKSSRLLSGFGGHKQAAGVRLAIENLEAFREVFSEIVRDKVGDTPAEPTLMLEKELNFREATDHVFLREMQLMQPFGPGNPEPVFMSPELTVRRVKTFGKDNSHLRLSLYDGKSNITMDAKAWRMADKFPENMVSKTIRIAYTPKLDSYNNLPYIDLGIKDWRKI